MKKINFKTRMQWSWFKAAVFGAVIAVMIVPTYNVFDNHTVAEQEKDENPVLSFLSSIHFGSKTKVMINGDIVALAKSEEAAQQAYKQARLIYNANGVQILDIDMTYAEVDKEADKEAIDGMKVLKEEKLANAIVESFNQYAEQDKSIAYTMRIDDYTVTVESMSDAIEMLEQAQGQYDVEDAFKVGLKLPVSRNVTMYEVEVAQKESAGNDSTESSSQDGESETGASEESTSEEGTSESSSEAGNSEEADTEQEDADEAGTEQTASEEPGAEQPASETDSSDENTSEEEYAGQEASGDETAVITIPEKQLIALTGVDAENGEDTDNEDASDGSSEESADGEGNGESTDDSQNGDSENPDASGDSQADNSENPEDEGSDTSGDNQSETESSEDNTQDATAEQVDADVAAQSVNDGIKYVGFSEKIQVMETYVSKDQITDKVAAYEELTAKNAEPDIYVVQPGDSLSVIAENHNMTVEEIKELNPGIESDDNIYYDDRLNITIPEAAVQILVQKQETYKEDYYADIVYEDDASMFIGETSVIQEGQSGTHTVTDLVTYMDDVEYEREQVQETVQVAAVAQVVLRGTKSKPTYMYPCTNWPITSNFGYRWGRLHAGTDVGVPTGTTVRASRGGQVSVAGWVGGYGNCVMIDHGDGVTTVYGHLSEINCSVGQYVDQGQQIALSGNTGRSTGPHLHFEIRVNGVAEDAMPYLLGEK